MNVSKHPLLMNQMWLNWKPISLNINENMNEYLLVMDDSWLMFAFVALVAFAMLTCIVIMLLYIVYRYYYLYTWFSCCLLSD